MAYQRIFGDCGRGVWVGLALVLAAQCAAQARLPVEFDADPGWVPHPTFLGNPAADPRVIVEDGAVTLRVSEPGCVVMQPGG